MDKELASFLRDNGLDNASFWIQQLKKLGVESKSSFQHLEEDMGSYSKLEKVAKYPVEKKALRKLLKIDQLELKMKEKEKEKKKEKKVKARDRKKKHKEKASEKSAQEKQELCEREEKAQKILEKLDKARSEGKERHDKRVQKLEDDMRKALDISPESWITKDQSLDTLIRKMEERHNASGHLQAREPLNERVLLQKVSGGRALQGVLLTKQSEDLLDDRSQLLEAPENVLITGASLSEDKIIQFSSEHEESSYKKTVNVLGHSVAVSASAPVYGSVTVSAGTSVSDRTEDEETHKQHQKETYSSTVKYSTIQVASYSFGNKDLKLSQDAKEELHGILQILSIEGATSTNAQAACERFFRTYGSHVNKGPLCFGGNFWWTCTSKGFSQSTTETVKKMQSEAISATAGVSFAGFGVSAEVNTDKIKASYQGKCSDDILASTRLQVKISGGPPEATDLPLWKSGLVANNSTWNLIDRGKKLIAVWDIIKKNHEKDLGKVREILRNTWEKISGFKAEQELTDNLLYDSESVLEEVSDWNEQECFTARQIQDNLKYLLEVKEDIFSKLANPKVWISQYLSQSSLQDFLESVIDSKLEPQYFEHIKFLMQRLVRQEDLAHLSTRSFPAIEEVSEWLYKSYKQPKTSNFRKNIVDFQSFVIFLEKIVQDARLAQLDSSGPLQRDAPQASIAGEVAMGVNALRSKCIKGSYDDILITILVHPFQNSYNEDIITFKPITLKNLKFLSECFSEQRAKFNSYLERKHHLQAYLFYLAVDFCYDTDRSLLQQFLQKILSMMKKLQPPLEQELLVELDEYTGSDSYALSVFKQNLQSLMVSPLERAPPPAWEDGKSCSLNDALKAVKPKALSEHQSSSVLRENPTAHKLFETLGISELYINKLRLRDALRIRSESLNFSLSDANPTDPKQLLMLILHKL